MVLLFIMNIGTMEQKHNGTKGHKTNEYNMGLRQSIKQNAERS